MDKNPVPTSVRKALVGLAATAGATVTTLVLTAASAAAGQNLNHNETAATDQT